MDQTAIIKKIREARSIWIELGDGKKIQIIRPTELQAYQKFYKKNGAGLMVFSLEFDAVKEFITAWDGFTEADILGQEIGSSDKIDYQPEFFDEVLADRIEWVPTIVSGLISEIEKAQKKKADSVKK